MNAIRNKEVHYDFVEIMSCPGGCINGGGQPYKEDASDVEARKNVLYGLDRHNSIRFSHENPSVQACYKEYFEKYLLIRVQRCTSCNNKRKSNRLICEKKDISWLFFFYPGISKI